MAEAAAYSEAGPASEPEERHPAETIMGAGHACTLERPEAFTAAIQQCATRVFDKE